MGIGFWAAEYMARAIRELDVRGSVLTLGKQDVWIDEDQYAQLVRTMNWGTVDGTGIAFFDQQRMAKVAEVRSQGLETRRR